MKVKQPDYDRSILSVAASLLRHYGVKEELHKSLPELDGALKKEPRNIILMLFDGLGSSILAEHLPENAFLRRRKVCDLSSVFPPTTTAATTSVQSGLSPLEHSWLGWTLYFKEISENVFVFPNKLERTGKRVEDYSVSQKFIPYKSIFEKIKEADPSVETHYIAMHTDEKAFTVFSAMRRIRRLSKAPGKKYIYFYWYQPDHAMHKYGVHSKQAGRIVRRLNRQAERLSKGLPEDSAAFVIADHGQINGRWAYLEDYPELNDMLLHAPSIEPRALSLFVKDGCRERFSERFKTIFGDSFLLLTKAQVYESGLFGSGTPGKKTDDFIGDFLAVATDELCLAENRKSPALLGNHAGLTEDEMTVPFIRIK